MVCEKSTFSNWQEVQTFEVAARKMNAILACTKKDYIYEKENAGILWLRKAMSECCNRF